MQALAALAASEVLAIYDNFVNFSSAEKRLKNFKYKLQQIEGYTQESSSLVGVTSNEADILKFDNLIRDEKNSFDGYENYLYNIFLTLAQATLSPLIFLCLTI